MSDQTLAVAGSRDEAHVATRRRSPAIVVTARDRARLLSLLDEAGCHSIASARFLRDEIERADVIEGGAAPYSLVVMGSTVEYVEEDSCSVCRVRLAHPDEVSDGSSISVFSPLGAALFGLGPGQSITWHDGERERAASVLSVEPPSSNGSVPPAHGP